MDKCVALIYPQMSTAVDYLPEDAVVCLSESPRVAERARNYQWRLEEDAKTLMESGLLPGELAAFSRTMDDLSHGLSDYPVVFLDTFFPRPPALCVPRSLLDVMAKQLPLSYGASPETAAADLGTTGPWASGPSPWPPASSAV